MLASVALSSVVLFCVVLLLPQGPLQNVALNVLSCYFVLCCVAPSTRASTKRGTECFVLCYVQNVALSVLCCVASFLKGLTKRGTECFVLWYFVLCSSFHNGLYKTWD